MVNKLFPIGMIVMSLGAAGVYALVDGDWRRCIYWVAAATITAVVTF